MAKYPFDVMQTVLCRATTVFIAFTMMGIGVGCGNAIDDLKMGDWQEAGSQQAPVPRLAGSAVLIPLESGVGPAVEPGDLVQVKVTVLANAMRARKEQRIGDDNIRDRTQSTATVWLYAGREPGVRDYENMEAWGNLGSARIRRVLIGHTLGERFRVDSSNDAEGYMDIPMHGFSVLGLTSRSLWPQESNPWPSLKIVQRRGSRVISAEMEIVRICRGRLYRRSGEMTQWGIVPNWGEMNYKTSRKGTLRWSAIEGDCPPPTGKVRFEIGPLYMHPPRQAGMLYNWQGSYRRARPPAKFPHEYDVRRSLRDLAQ